MTPDEPQSEHAAVPISDPPYITGLVTEQLEQAGDAETGAENVLFEKLGAANEVFEHDEHAGIETIDSETIGVETSGAETVGAETGDIEPTQSEQAGAE